ncbi:Thioredoxin [Bacillus sp. 491mf]|uniref:thioredoxin domain-containing protein n=1 Tax=Bacillus TaxID=1386 RepID=UPI000554EA7B|nr:MULTISPECIES: thioredoxin domain-containing protein [unclassified Bacillus (in: firmicutes)]SFD26982.1 Thioredoxin [Bacillus sp. 491mf]
MDYKRICSKLLIVALFIIIPLIFTSCKQTSGSSSKPIDLSEGIAVGDKSAPLQFIEYSSFQCPDCKKLHQNIQDVLQKYIDEKKIFYVFKPVDVQRFANDQYVYKNFSNNNENFNMIKTAFEKQDQWSNAKNEEEVKQILGLENIDTETQNKRKETMNRINIDLKERGIKEVPSFYINGKKFVGVYSKEEFKKLLTKAEAN